MEDRTMFRDEGSNRRDAALARLAAEGDAAAFDEIYSRYRRFVYSIALRMTGNLADAEDLTQDSFVSVLRRIGSFRGEASFTTWLYRVVVNEVKMHFRRRKCRPEDQTSDGELPERKPNPARRTDSQQVIDRLAIEEAMQRLPPGYRTAFELYDVERYKHKEIARLLGCSEGTSKSQLHKARVSLRKLLSARSHALQT
jgi:RNA polymerase sigma-70 factor (ECF subfamily)